MSWTLNRKFKVDKMRLAVDGSSDMIGWAIFDGTKRLDSGTYSAASGKLDKRIESIRIFIEMLVKQYNVHDLILEDIHLQYRNRSPQVHVYRALAMTRGVLGNVGTQNGCDVYFLCPNEWRSELGIKCGGKNLREDSKQSVMEYITNLMPNKPDIYIDEAEAIAIGIAFLRHNIKELDK